MIDIRRLCQKYSVQWVEAGHRHVSDGWIGLNCPVCSSGSGFHLGFSLTSGAFNCWRCGALKFRDVMPLLLNISPGELGQILAEFGTGDRAVRKVVARLPNATPPPGTGPMIEAHRRYLRERGFDPEALERDWGLQGTGPTGGRWAWRVVIPIRNEVGRVVGYQGRAIGPKVSPRYRMSRNEICAEDPQGFVYGIHRAVGDSVAIVEGAPGVWRLGSGAVATMGIDWKGPQANRLRRFKRRMILFDPDAGAQRRAGQLAATLAAFEGETEIVTGFLTDPGDFSAALAAKVMRELGVP